MASLTLQETEQLASLGGSLESLAEDILKARDYAENIDIDGADDLAHIVRLLNSAENSLRWLRGDFASLNDEIDGRGELCDECENPVDECTCDENGLDRLEDGE